MSRFQACIGPSASRAHIRDTTSNSPLVLCESTTNVRDLKGRVEAAALCFNCMRAMAGIIRKQSEKIPEFTAEIIGVEEII